MRIYIYYLSERLVRYEYYTEATRLDPFVIQFTVMSFQNLLVESFVIVCIIPFYLWQFKHFSWSNFFKRFELFHYIHARNIYRRLTQRLRNSLRRCATSQSSIGNTVTLPDICSHSYLDRDGTFGEGKKKRFNLILIKERSHDNECPR